MKVLLISMSNVWRSSNIGVDQLAGYLRDRDYQIDIKYYHKKESAETIINDLPKDYDLYGFSVHSSNFDKCIKVSEYLKKVSPDTTVLYGGSFVTMYYREVFLETNAVDYMILGDGEKPSEVLLQALMKDSVPEHKSIVTKTDIINDTINKKPYCNQEIMHSPIFDYYEQDSQRRNSRKIYCIQTKNNICTGKCSFCTERKGPIVYKPVKQIVDEIAYVAETFGIKKIFITDDNILDPNNSIAKERVRQLCLEIQKLNLPLVFECYIKAISLKDCAEDHELLKLMSDTGFKTIFVGLEAGNNQDLVLYNKFTTVDDNETIIKMLHLHDIVPLIGFINFNPYSTLLTLKQNYHFLMRIRSTNLFQYVCSFLRVHKYTAIYEKMVTDGLITHDFNYRSELGYDFVHRDVKELFMFVYDFMYPRVRGLEIELDWVYQYFKECTVINPQAALFEDELLSLKKQQLEMMKQFFYTLYVDRDLDLCQNQVDDFLTYFEGLQPRLLEIYRKLVELFSQVN